MLFTSRSSFTSNYVISLNSIWNFKFWCLFMHWNLSVNTQTTDLFILVILNLPLFVSHFFNLLVVWVRSILRAPIQRFLHSIVRKLESEWRVRPHRRHSTNSTLQDWFFSSTLFRIHVLPNLVLRCIVFPRENVYHHFLHIERYFWNWTINLNLKMCVDRPQSQRTR